MNGKRTENLTLANIEKLAKAIHENYMKEQTAAGNTQLPNAVPWEELTEEFKESNRNAARSFEEKLNSVGYAIASGDSPHPAVTSFDDATILKLSKAEHDRWMNEKLANGWTYAPVRDNAQKHHPMLIPFEQLSQEEKDKDTAIVKNMIPLLASVGLGVYRITES